MVNSSRADDDRGGGRVRQAAALSLRDSQGIMAWDLAFAVEGLGFGVWASGFRVRRECSEPRARTFVK